MNCIIIDDEPLARERLRDLLSEISFVELLAEFSNVRSAQTFMEQTSVDLVLLDINLSGDNGLEFAKILSDTMVVFVTAYANYAVESYEIDAVDYLVKPVTKERFAKAMDRARLLCDVQRVQNSVEQVNADYVIVKADRKFHKISLDHILFIAGLKDYVAIYTTDQKYLAGMNIKTMLAKLPNKRFLRTSKSYIVNKDYVSSFDYNTVFVNDHELPLGKIYQKDFFDFFSI